MKYLTQKIKYRSGMRVTVISKAVNIINYTWSWHISSVESRHRSSLPSQGTAQMDLFVNLCWQRKVARWLFPSGNPNCLGQLAHRAESSSDPSSHCSYPSQTSDSCMHCCFSLLQVHMNSSLHIDWLKWQISFERSWQPRKQSWIQLRKIIKIKRNNSHNFKMALLTRIIFMLWDRALENFC